MEDPAQIWMAWSISGISLGRVRSFGPYPTFFGPRNSRASHGPAPFRNDHWDKTGEIFPSISSVDKSSALKKWLVFGGIGKNIVKVLDPMTDLWGEVGIFTYIYLVDVYGFHVGKCIGKYTSPMDPIGMGKGWMGSPRCHLKIQPPCATLHLAVENGEGSHVAISRKQPENHVHRRYGPEHMYIYIYMSLMFTYL